MESQKLRKKYLHKKEVISSIQKLENTSVRKKSVNVQGTWQQKVTDDFTESTINRVVSIEPQCGRFRISGKRFVCMSGSRKKSSKKSTGQIGD